MSQKNVDLEPKWYVIHTYSGKQSKGRFGKENKKSRNGRILF